MLNLYLATEYKYVCFSFPQTSGRLSLGIFVCRSGVIVPGMHSSYLISVESS